MDEFQIFPNAPITEAILDIKVELPKDADLNIFDSFANKIKDHFQDKKTRRSFQVSFEISPGKEEAKPAIPTGKEDGYIFHSKEENKSVQARLDGFSFNKFTPYESWGKFSKEAKGLWEYYQEVSKPINISRIALRYINKIDLPLPFGDFDEYILTNPKVAPKLPQSLSHFLMRMEIPNEKIGALAIITQTIQKVMNNKLPLIFDIDVIKTENFINDQSSLWAEFELLRNFKNEIFHYSLTDKAKDLFK